MFVRSLSLSRFRGVRETEEPIRLRKFNVLLGRNNSGKTTVLEALSLLPHPSAELPWISPDIPAKVPKAWTAPPRAWMIIRWLHRGDLPTLLYRYHGIARVSYELEVGAKILKPEVEISAENCELLTDGAYTDWDIMADELNLPKPDMDELAKLVLFIPDSDEFMRRLSRAVYENFELVEATGAHNRVVGEVIDKCVDEKFTEVVPFKQELRLRRECPDGTSFHVRLEDVGDGLERVVPVLLWLGTLRPKLVLWDDFEANMHPSLVGAVLEWLAERDWQVVLATHSLDVLYALLDVWPEDAQLILLCRTADDVLRASYMELEELDRAVRAHQDPRYLVEWLKL